MKHLLTPHITEKSYGLIPEGTKDAATYTFRMRDGVRKEDVKRIVEEQFKVTVVDVRTISLPGKARRFKGFLGRTSPVYKALVRLKAGDRIEAFMPQVATPDSANE